MSGPGTRTPLESTKMTKRRWLVALLAAMLLLSGAAWAQEDTSAGEDDGPDRKTKKIRKKKDRGPKVRKDRKEKKQKGSKVGKARKGEWEKKWAPMASQLGLSAEQTAALQQKVAARQAAIEEWNQANAEKIKTIKASMKEARSNGNKDEMKKLKGEMNELNKARKNVESEATAACMAVLTAEQRKQWGGIQFCDRILRKYRKAKLDEAQQAKAKELCLATVAQVATADRKARRGIMKKLDSDIRALLTDEQKQTMSARAKGKHREKGDRPDKPRRNKKNRKQAEVVELD